MATGTIKFFNNDKGFGFIKPDNGGSDIFLHVSALNPADIQHLSDGQIVSYETQPDNRGKGPRAVDIRIL